MSSPLEDGNLPPRFPIDHDEVPVRISFTGPSVAALNVVLTVQKSPASNTRRKRLAGIPWHEADGPVLPRSQAPARLCYCSFVEGHRNRAMAPLPMILTLVPSVPEPVSSRAMRVMERAKDTK
jgi:hypothetical protein